MEKNMDDLIEHTVPEDYEEYISRFKDFTDDPMYASPRMRWVKPFKWVDQKTEENYTGGHADKWFVRGNVSLFRDLIKEIRTNPNSSYETCYTEKEIINGDIPDYFSMLLKKPDTLFEREADVFVSHILNYFELPVVYNRSFDKAYPVDYVEHFLMSVDVIRPNEKLVLLNEITPVRGRSQIRGIEERGVEDTLFSISIELRNYLDYEGIKYTDKEIEEYIDFLALSILIRRVWLGDYDLRNVNAGILVNLKDKTFRALPNFDMEKSFSSFRPALNREVLEQFYNYNPEMYEKFIERMVEFLFKDKKGESPCFRMADKLIRDDSIKNSIILAIYSASAEIWNITNQIKSDRADKEKQVVQKEILV